MSDRKRQQLVEDEIKRDITAAFREVFGTSAARTKAQLVVMARLRQLAKVGRPTLATWTERQVATREGRMQMYLEIESRTELNPPPTLKDLFGHMVEPTGENDDDY